MRARLAIFAVGLLTGACEGTDLGALITPAPPPCVGEACPPVCPGPDCPTPPPPPCDPAAPDLECGVGVCAVTVPACLDGAPNVCRPGEPGVELCNDLDDDCDGWTDEGCDDDEDLYCDADMVVVGTPAVCPKGGDRRLDCDDTDPTRHPARPEICDDGIDNNCDGLADYLDFEGCTHITASFEDEDGVRVIDHGTLVRVRATVTPPTEELEREWRVVSAVPDDHCAAEDVIFESPVETEAATQRQVGIVDDPTKLDCAYTIELVIGGVAADRLRIEMRNMRPRVGAIVGGTFDEATLVVTLAEGTNPNIVATVPEDPDAPVTVRWSGPDSDLLACNAPCETDRVRFGSPPAAGSYDLRVLAADSFDGVFRSRNVRVEVVPCVWARVGGTGGGGGPQLANAQADLLLAVRTAAEAGQNACFAAGGRYEVSSVLQLPASVGLLGGFDGQGNPANNNATVAFSGAGRLTFAAGHAGRVRRVILNAGPASPLVSVLDASPVLEGVQLRASGGTNRVALDVRAVDRPVNVQVRSAVVRIDGAPQAATGVRVEGEADAQATLRTNGTTRVELVGCRGTCRGVVGRGRSNVRLSGRIVDVEAAGAGSEAYGVDLAAVGGLRPTGFLGGHARITAYSSPGEPADVTVGLALSRTEGVLVRNNTQLGPRTETSGRRFSAGIADGRIDAFGQIVRGDSERLVVEGNRRIAAGRWRPAWDLERCDDQTVEAGLATGTEIGAGILLVGTRTSTLTGNGDNASRDNAVFGAASTSVWRDPNRALPPMVPGVWTIDTQDVRIENNELRGGVLSALPGCDSLGPAPVEVVRDGLAPYMQASLPSRGLVLAANGIVTGRSGPLSAAPNVDQAPAIGVVLGGPGEVRLENDYVAVTRGSALTALHAYGPGRFETVNSTFEVDRLNPAMELAERGLVFEGPGDRGVALVNSIVLVRDTGASGAVALELREAAPEQAFGQFAHDLIFIEAAARDPSSAYLVTPNEALDEAAFTDYAPRLGAGTLVLPPLFQAHPIEHRRSISRLSDRSPAIDAGQDAGAPAVDRFGTERPQGPAVDIGHHERE